MAGVEEVHILWISELLGCDGDSVSITAAMQPSIEDVVMGNIPGLPTVHLHNKVLAYELGGSSLLEPFEAAERGELSPFVLVLEGSIPNEDIKAEGYWAGMGNDPVTGQPRRTVDRIRALAPKALAVGCVRPLRPVWRYPRHGGKRHWRDGRGRLPRLGLPDGCRDPHRQRAGMPGSA